MRKCERSVYTIQFWREYLFNIEMAEDEEVIAILLAVYASNKIKKKQRKTRSTWVKPYLKRRNTMSAYQLVNELRLTDEHEYRCYLRMDTSTFMVSFWIVLFLFIIDYRIHEGNK